MATPLTPLSAAEMNLSPSKSLRRIKASNPTSPMSGLAIDGLENVTPRLSKSLSAASPGKPLFGPLIELEVTKDEAHDHDEVATPTKPAPPPSTCVTSAVDDEVLPESVQPTPLRDNEGLTGVITAMESERSQEDRFFEDEGDSVMTIGADCVGTDMDDTAFSAFSAVPNADMTLFARLGHVPSWSRGGSPQKASDAETPSRGGGGSDGGDHTPRQTPNLFTPDTARREVDDDFMASPSPTPRRKTGPPADTDTTNLILDFTDQFNALAASSTSYTYTPSRRGPVKSHTQPNLALHMARARSSSPSKHALPPPTPFERRNLATLLDFDIPPAPTPRSLPSISARELESLKSSYMSQISSLKASLSGKEAETKALMEAVSDAERRVGEAQEGLREERGAREGLQAEKDSWEQRAKDMERVIRGVKDEVLEGERERTELAGKVEEADRRREEAEAKAFEAESRLAALKARSTSDGGGGGGSGSGSGGAAPDTQSIVDAAVEKVARELHALYKAKHATKINAMKKSNDMKWEGRLKDAQDKLEAAQMEIEELKSGRDATLTGILPLRSTSTSNSYPKEDQAGSREDHAELAEQQQQQQVERTRSLLEEQKARVTGLTEELASLKHDNDRLIHELERERLEKGDLVAAVEEMLSISATTAATTAAALGGGPGPGPGPGPLGVGVGVGMGASAAAAAGMGVGVGVGAVMGAGANVGGAGAGGIGQGADPSSSVQSLDSSFRISVSRPLGRRAPTAPTTTTGVVGAGESRIGRVGVGVGSGSVGSSQPRSKSGSVVTTTMAAAGKSGMMSNIERMGRGGGGGHHF